MPTIEDIWSGKHAAATPRFDFAEDEDEETTAAAVVRKKVDDEEEEGEEREPTAEELAETEQELKDGFKLPELESPTPVIATLPERITASPAVVEDAPERVHVDVTTSPPPTRRKTAKRTPVEPRELSDFEKESNRLIDEITEAEREIENAKNHVKEWEEWLQTCHKNLKEHLLTMAQ